MLLSCLGQITRERERAAKPTMYKAEDIRLSGLLTIVTIFFSFHSRCCRFCTHSVCCTVILCHAQILHVSILRTMLAQKLWSINTERPMKKGERARDSDMERYRKRVEMKHCLERHLGHLISDTCYFSPCIHIHLNHFALHNNLSHK